VATSSEGEVTWNSAMSKTMTCGILVDLFVTINSSRTAICSKIDFLQNNKTLALTVQQELSLPVGRSYFS